MAIFKKAKKQGKLVGAIVPSWVHAYLSMYGTAKNISKTDIFKKLIDDFIEEQRSKESEEDLINQIVLRCKRTYKSKPLKHDIDIDQFREEAAAELRTRNVPEGYIKIIIRRITFP